MTEGIIQKVLNKYIEEYYSYLQATKERPRLQYTHYEGIIAHFEKAKQELIEEIRKSAIRPLPGMPYMYLDQLIGDSKE